MCRCCKRFSHVSINNSTQINEKFVLTCLHTCTGHSHIDSYLNIAGLPSISNQKFKGFERKVGKEIEQVPKESCKKWKKAELEKEKKLDRSKENWDLLMYRGGKFSRWTWSYLSLSYKKVY